jgi:DNA-binding beta-propeller fold protein YncE
VVTTLSSTLGDGPIDITTDGQYIWTANLFGSISRVDPDTGATTTLTAGFNSPFGILFDGASLWVSDIGVGMLRKLDSSGAIVQNVTVGRFPTLPVFDGSKHLGA